MKKRALFLFLLIVLVYFVTAQEFYKEHAYSEINLRQPFVMTIDDFTFPVSKIEVFVNKSFFNVKVKAENIEDYFLLEDTTYYQFRLSSDLDNENIEATRITFRVNNNFIDKNDVLLANIYLAKYDNGWKKLETNYLMEDIGVHYYSAVSDGMYVFAIAAEQEDEITIKTESLPSNIVRGRTFVVPIKIKNTATIAKDYTISVKDIEELADWKVEVGPKNLPEIIRIDSKKTKDISLILSVKNTAPLGKNSFVVVIESDEVMNFPITINIKGIDEVLGESVVEIEKQFEEIEENDNKIRISITNNGVDTGRYIIKTKDIEYFGDYSIEPSNIALVDSGQTKNVFLNIVPKSNIEEDIYDFSVSVESNLEVVGEKSYSINVVPYYRQESTDLTPIVISVALLIVALIFFISARKRSR